jgi:hypothetical protein
MLSNRIILRTGAAGKAGSASAGGQAGHQIAGGAGDIGINSPSLWWVIRLAGPRQQK